MTLREIELWSEAVELLTLVLLGCRVAGPAVLSPPALRRAERALQAYRDGLSEHIVACGGKAWAGVREADALCAYLIEQGVPERFLERELWSESTRRNAHFAAQLLIPRGILQVGLITCDWHMPRALRSFRGAGFDARAMPAESPSIPDRARLLRSAREHLSLALDNVATRGFSRV